MTTTTQPTTLPAFLDGFAAMHAAMRRDADRLPRAAALLRTTADASALGRWYGRFRASIEHHHQREDAIIWPELARRAPSFEEAQAELLEDHHALDLALTAMSDALADRAAGRTSSNDAAVTAAERLADLLVEHLAREEAAAFPLIAVAFTAEEYEAVERQLVKGTSFAALAFEVPWVLDELDPIKVEAMRERAPWLIRAAHRVLFARRYAALAAPVLAVAR
jgi:iron-sulfur cluster repair protein YtfE (RIC family)